MEACEDAASRGEEVIEEMVTRARGRLGYDDHDLLEKQTTCGQQGSGPL